MAYLKTKKNKGRKYYYAVESKRINGKPRTVNQIYLGTIEQLIANKLQADTPQPPKEVAVFEFGIVATCFKLAEKLNIVESIDQIVPKSGTGLSIGQYILIAAISRAVEPISKRACWDWYRQTCLPRLMVDAIRKKDLSSQRFWDHMHMVPVSAIPKIEKEISQKVIELYNLNLRFLIYDTTNYYTFIDTFNERNHIAKRGKNKQKRYDLRQVNLALAVTRDFHIPLFHKLYEGNTNDCKSFTSIVDELINRYKLLKKYCEDITIIYDKGNNSKKNQQKLDVSSYHFIGSLKLSEYPRLAAFDTTSKEFKPLDNNRLKNVTAYRTTEVAFGKERTIVVTFSHSFYKKQKKTLLREIKKCNNNLKELQIKLQKRLDARAVGKSLPGKPPTYKSVDDQVKTILKHQYMKDIFDVRIVENDELVKLDYHFLPEKFAEIQKTRLGKTILFTDQDKWSTTDIILGYRGQYRIEAAFKITKRGHFIAWQPTYHWTDQKLHIHAFYCVLSLLFISLAHRQVWQAGIEIGLPTLENELKSIKEVLTLQLPPSGKLEKALFYRTLTKMTVQQQKIYEALELFTLAPDQKLGTTK
jgi:transposase